MFVVHADTMTYSNRSLNTDTSGCHLLAMVNSSPALFQNKVWFGVDVRLRLWLWCVRFLWCDSFLPTSPHTGRSSDLKPQMTLKGHSKYILEIYI